MTTILLLSMFLTTFLLLIALHLTWNTAAAEGAVREPKTVQGTLKGMNQQLKVLLVRRKKSSLRKDKLEQRLSVAGIPMKPEEFVVLKTFAVFITSGIAFILFQSVIMLLLGAIFGFMGAELWLKGKQTKRMKQFNEGLPGMITSIIGSLRAGFSLPQSLQMIAEESYSPIKEEVQLVLKSMQYGKGVEDAMIDWKKRMPSGDLDLLVEAILIQRQVGGNLAYLLGKIVETTRERTKIEGQIKTLTAQGKLSGIIIGLLPLGLGLVIYMMNPDYMGNLFINPIGQVMLGAAFVSGIIGFIFVRKITTIEV